MMIYTQMIQLNAPIFISVELSKTFIEEYPFCSTKKNIIMPYPLIDPDFYSTKLLNPGLRRDKLVFYLGGDHGSCVPVRNALNEISRCVVLLSPTEVGDTLFDRIALQE